MSTPEDRANELVCRYIVSHYREDNSDREEHLVSCPDITVEDADSGNSMYGSSYGCDPGCEYVKFEAVLTCPHGERVMNEFGEFGDMASILKELERQESRQ